MNRQSTILIVDDEPVGCRTLRTLLMAHGYNLSFAGNGPEALAMAAELTPGTGNDPVGDPRRLDQIPRGCKRMP